MSVTPILVCDKFRDFFLCSGTIEDTFHSHCVVISQLARFVALGVEDTLYILGTAEPGKESQLNSIECRLPRPISSLFTISICKETEVIDTVLVGTIDGCVLFVDVEGVILFELCLGSLSIRSIQLFNDGDLKHLAILCDSTVVCLVWEELVNVLFSCRSIVRSSRPSDFQGTELHIQCQTLALPVENRNFQFTCSEPTLLGLFNDCVHQSVHHPDDPVKYTSPTPIQSRWVVTGRRPCMTFNRMGKTAPSLPSLLLAEAKRMIFGSRSARSDKHILRIRYGLDGKNSSIPTASVQKPPSVQLDLSRALTDQHRECCPTGLVISADRQWLAVTDNLGRVLLVDAQRERVVRIWKGYRDAELAFYELTDRSGSTTRDTRCLLIHAPHRRMLELFRLVHGPCLSTWDVDEPARLIPGCHQIIGDFYPTYGLDRLRGIYQVFLLDSRGVLYTLRLSTALCLAETDSEAALNYHEYQVLQACYACLEQLHILGPAAVSTQLLEHFARFKSATWFERAIRNMCLPTETFVDFIGDCITFLSERVSDPNVVQLREFRRLLAQLSKMHSVMLFYQSAASNIENLMHGESVQTDISELSSDTYAGAWFTDAESVADLLNWDVDDATRCLSVYAICSRILLPSSHMRLSKPVDVRTFRDCFKYTVDDNLLKSNPQNLADSVSVEICPDDSTSRFSKIGAVIFAPYLLMKQSFKDLIELISLNVLSPTILLYALTCYILHRDTFRRIPNLIRRVHQLYAFLLVRFFESDVTSSPPAPLDCSNRTEAIQSTEPLSGESASMHNSFWRMWQKLHDFVVTSSQLSSAYLLSLVFRSLLYQAWESVDRDASLVRGWIACAQQHTFDTANCTQGDFLGVSQPDALIEVHHSRGSTPPFVAQTDDNPSVSLKPVGRQPPRSLVSLSTLNTLIEQWHDTCTRLEDLFILGLLVQLPASELSRGEHEKDVVKEPQVFPITLRRALTCGRACLTELFSAWLVHWHLQPDELISFYQNMCKSADSCTTPSDCTELALSKPFDLVKTLFPLVYKRLPFTLELDVVVASVCWIHYQRWLNDAKSMIHLQHCIEFLRRLSSAGVTIAQGLCSLMWKGGIGRLFDHCFTAVCGTSQGRFTPAAVRSVKEQSIIVMRFFSVFSHALQKSEAVPVFSVEREWSGLANSYTFSGEDALHSRTRSDHQAEEPFSPSAEWIARSVSHSDFMINLSHSLIAEVAVNCHPVPDRKLVALWEQSAIVVAALSTFSLLRKRSRPSRAGTEFYSIQDFFPISDARSLFANTVPDWATQPISFESDSGLDNRRRLFITWLIDRAVRSYGKSSDAHLVDRSSRSVSPSEDFPKPTSSMPHQNPGRHASSALDVYAMFTSSATTLARHWGLPRDTVLVQHVVALFEANLDDQAELYLSQVEDTGSLATRLLIVVGRRVSWYCFGAHNPEIVSYQLRWRACVPFDLESWLRGLQPENVSNSFREITNDLEFATEFNRLICLIDYIMDRIPSHASQIHMAESLRDAIYAMHEID